MNLAVVLRKWRLMSEITLRDAGKQIGVSAATLLRIEQGKGTDGRTMARLIAWLVAEARTEGGSR